MQNDPREKMRRIWNQKTIPVLLRRGRGHRLRLRLPYQADNRSWVRGSRRAVPGGTRMGVRGRCAAGLSPASLVLEWDHLAAEC